MQTKFWASTDAGCVREHNEDNFLVDKRLNLFVVCDGMGGHAAGEVASAIGVQTVRDVVSAHRDVIKRLVQSPDDVPTRREILQVVERAILDANAQIFKSAFGDASRRGMGTTCSLLLLAARRGFIAHVGDSRVYLLRDGQVHQMTEDHSLYNEMVRLGKIKPGEAVNLPNKNAVTRAVGVREYLEVDVMEFVICPGDRILACSDGLSGYFKNDEMIIEMLRPVDVRAVTERFIEFAVESGGRDNVTAIVVDVDVEVAESLDEDRKMIEEVVEQSPFFEYLNTKEAQDLTGLLQKRVCAQNEELFSQADVDTDLYMVLHGEVCLKRHGTIFRTLTPGEYTGELAFIDAHANDFSACVDSSATVLVLERAKFMKMLRVNPTLAVKLLWNFLQIFAIKLRQVPTDVAFMPIMEELIEDQEDRNTQPAFEEVVLEDAMFGFSHNDQSLEQTTSEAMREAAQLETDVHVSLGLVEETIPSTIDVERDEDLCKTAEFDKKDILPKGSLSRPNLLFDDEKKPKPLVSGVSLDASELGGALEHDTSAETKQPRPMLPIGQGISGESVVGPDSTSNVSKDDA